MDSDVREEDWATACDEELHLELLRAYGNIVDCDPYSAFSSSSGDNVSEKHASEDDDCEKDDPFAELRNDIATWDDDQMLAHLQTVAAEESDVTSTNVEGRACTDEANESEKEQAAKIHSECLASVQEQLSTMEDQELEMEIETDGDVALDEKKEARVKVQPEHVGEARRGVKRDKGTDSDDKASAPDCKVRRSNDHRASVPAMHDVPVTQELSTRKPRSARRVVCPTNTPSRRSSPGPTSTPSRSSNPEEIELEDLATLWESATCPSPEIELDGAPDGNPEEIESRGDSPAAPDSVLALLTENKSAPSGAALAPLLEAIPEEEDIDLSDSADSAASPITPTSEDGDSVRGGLKVGKGDDPKANGDAVVGVSGVHANATEADAAGTPSAPEREAMAEDDEMYELEFDQEIELSADEEDEVPVQARTESRVGSDDAQPESREAGADDAAIEEEAEEWELEIDDTLEIELDEVVPDVVPKVVPEVVEIVDADDDAVVAATEEDAVEDVYDDFVATAFDGYELSDEDIMPSPCSASMASTVDDDRISLASHDQSVDEPPPAASSPRRSRAPSLPSPKRPPQRRRLPSRASPRASAHFENESAHKSERSAGSESGSGSESDSAIENAGRQRLERRERMSDRDRDHTRDRGSDCVSSVRHDVNKKEVLSPKSKLRDWLKQTCRANYEDNVRELFSSLGLVEKQVAPPRAKLSFALKSGSQRPDVGKELSEAGFQSATSLAASSAALPKKEIKRAVAKSRPLELLRKYTLEADIPSFLQGNVLFFRDGVMYPGKTLLPLTDGESKTCITLAQLWMLATLGESYKEKGSKLFHEYGIKRLRDDAVDPLLAYLTGATDHCIFASSPVIEKPPLPISNYQTRDAPVPRMSEASAPRVPKAPCDSASKASRAPPLPPRRKEKEDDTPMPFSKSKARSKADNAQRAEGEAKFNKFLRDEFATMVEISELSVRLEATRKRRMNLAKAFGGIKTAASATTGPKNVVNKTGTIASASGAQHRGKTKEPIHA